MADLKLNEQQVRRIVLVRAIEEADLQGKLAGKAEIEQLEQRAFMAARHGGQVDNATALDQRAELVLQAVAKRDASVSALQNLSVWRSWLVYGVPLVALVLGVATDRIANPHRVDLLALPLLLILLWNVAVYLVMAAAFFLRPGEPSSAPFAPLMSALAGTAHRSAQFGKLNRDIGRKFLMHLQEATASANDQRIRQVLHFAAAAWGAGVILSLVLRGFVVEYRTGWESTMLNAEQVHAILNVLFLPVRALFSLEPFTLQEITNMRFDAGGGGEASHGRRWVVLYTGLLAIVVVVPRLVLGLVAWSQARHYSKRMTLDLGDPYFEDLIEKLCPAQVQVYVHTHRPSDKAALERVLLHGRSEIDGRELIASPYGDSLSVVDSQPPAVAAQKPLWDRLRTPLALRGEPPPDSAADLDIVLHVISDPADLAAAEWLHALGKPVLVLVKAPASVEPQLVELCRLHRAQHPQSRMAVLSFAAFSGCWVQESVLFDEMAHLLPRAKAKGFQRLKVAWTGRSTTRFKRAMFELGKELVTAAADKERVAGDPRTLRNLVSPGQRDLHKQATVDAEATLAERLEARARTTYLRLLALHGLATPAAMRPNLALEGDFNVQSSLNTSQAAMGGAATGATVGASVDLMTGGLTLGAAALLGALVGGSGAALASVWKSRSGEPGVTTVQLPDELLELVTVERLLGYLQVIHLDDAAIAEGQLDTPPYWKGHVQAATMGRRAELAPIWAAARGPHEAESLAQRLADELEGITSKVLVQLYPTYQNAA